MNSTVPDLPDAISAWRKYWVDERGRLRGFRGQVWDSPFKDARCGGDQGPPCPGGGGRRITTCYVHQQRRWTTCPECLDWRDEHWCHGVFAYSEPDNPELSKGDLLASVRLWGWVWPHNAWSVYRAQHAVIEEIHMTHEMAEKNYEKIDRAVPAGIPIYVGLV